MTLYAQSFMKHVVFTHITLLKVMQNKKKSYMIKNVYVYAFK